MSHEDENYSEEVQQYPETVPQLGPNLWDIVRVLLYPVLGLFQGYSAMFGAFQDYALLQSQVHDEKKASEDLERSFK